MHSSGGWTLATQIFLERVEGLEVVGEVNAPVDEGGECEELPLNGSQDGPHLLLRELGRDDSLVDVIEVGPGAIALEGLQSLEVAQSERGLRLEGEEVLWVLEDGV